MTAKLITTCAVLHMAGPTADENGGRCIGHCPACHKAVMDSDDGVPTWICPTDLQEGNPHREDATVSEELQEREGIYGNCAEEFGLWCGHERMPLHAACYDSQTLTY